MRHFYSQFISKGDLVFDVGANVGDRSEIFLSLGAQVIAFEPLPYCHKKLENLACENFTLVKSAVGDVVGRMEMNVSDNAALSTLNKNWLTIMKANNVYGANWNDAITVSVTTLSDHIKKFGLPKFIKIDVEGYEPYVLAGLAGLAPPALSFEFTSYVLDDTLKCIDMLNLMGDYKFNYQLGNSMTFVLSQFCTANELKDILMTADTNLMGDIYGVLEQ
jgi:FkbM family methyltransferase